MYCGQCGYAVKKEVQFCPCCGAIMEDTSERDAAGVYTGRSTRKVHHRKWPWVLAVLVVLAGAIAAVCYFRNLQESAVEEVEFITGKDSYTALITSYLEEASANDQSDLLNLFFPNAQEYYQNADGTRSTLEILRLQDNWTDYYGYRAVSAELEDAVFVELDSTSAQTVTSIIAKYGDIQEISEIYTVTASISYQNGLTAKMLFEIVQCEYGLYLVSVDIA